MAMDHQKMDHQTKKSVAATSSSRQEIFRRIKTDQLVTVILQSVQAQHEESLVLRALESEQTADLPPKADNDDVATTIQNFVNGVGEKTNSRQTTNVKVDVTRPFLLLDARLPEEYSYGHIITATNYPHTMLSRERYETPEMKAYKNNPGKMIVIYDDAERNGPRVASTILQRGYTNCVLLSGGIMAAAKKYPNGLITGRIWDPLNPPKAPVAAQTATKAEFSQEDLDVLRYQLQHNLMPKVSRSANAIITVLRTKTTPVTCTLLQNIITAD